MSTFAIGVGIDPNDLTVQETTDNFGAFPTREAAAEALIAMAERRMEALRRSKAIARRALHAVKGRHT